MTSIHRWAPAGLFSLGAALVHGFVAPQTDMPLARPLASSVPASISGFSGEDIEVSSAEARVAGFSDYLMRVFPVGEGSWVSVYVGYYESQTEGKTIHSPKNCLPGGGWEPLQSTVADVTLKSGETARVNRYLLQRDEERALVLYWYQGRGRISHNEYVVKAELLRDAVLRRRTDEALVRIVVPLTSSEEDAFSLAIDFAREMIPLVGQALPE